MPDPNGQWRDPITGEVYAYRPWWAALSQGIAPIWAGGRLASQSLARAQETYNRSRDIDWEDTEEKSFFPRRPSRGTVWEPKKGIYGRRTPTRQPAPRGEELGEGAGLPEWALLPGMQAGAEQAVQPMNVQALVSNIENLAMRLGINPDKYLLAYDSRNPIDQQIAGLTQAYKQLLYQAKQWVSPESVGGRQNLAEAVASGQISWEEAYGKGSAWEKWQHEGTDVERRQTLAKETYSPEDKNLADRLVQSGYPEQAQNYLNTMASLARQGGLESEGAGLTRWGAQNLVTQTEGQRRMQELRIIASEYPEWYQKYIQKRGGTNVPNASDYKSDIELSGGRDVPEGASPISTAAGGWISAEDQLMTGFGSYLQNNPEFEKARVSKEAGLIREWGPLYNSYQKWKAIADEYKPFPGWIEATPSAKATYEEMRFEKEAPKRKAIPQWAVRAR